MARRRARRRASRARTPHTLPDRAAPSMATAPPAVIPERRKKLRSTFFESPFPRFNHKNAGRAYHQWCAVRDAGGHEFEIERYCFVLHGILKQNPIHKSENCFCTERMDVLAAASRQIGNKSAKMQLAPLLHADTALANMRIRNISIGSMKLLWSLI